MSVQLCGCSFLTFWQHSSWRRHPSTPASSQLASIAAWGLALAATGGCGSSCGLVERRLLACRESSEDPSEEKAKAETGN